MTKQGSHPRRHHRGSLWIAMLATLAFAGAGQALAPAHAAAFHTDACEQPESGLCTPLDDSPTSGDQPGGDGKGSGHLDPWANPPPRPPSPSWDDREPNGTLTWSIPGLSLKIHKHICGMISDHLDHVEARIRKARLVVESHDRDFWVYPDIREMRALLWERLRDLDHRWDEYDCTELGL